LVKTDFPSVFLSDTDGRENLPRDRKVRQVDDLRDLGNIAAISRLLLQDASDVFDVIETRGLEAKYMAS